jgi:acyl dehydratase
VGRGFSFEDLPVGRQFKTIGRTVTEADITNFVNCTGMVEVLFTNLEFLAHASDIKRRLAPAALVYAFAEGLLVQSTMQHTGLAFLHMELNVENAVFAGDTVHAECEIIEARRSTSRPDRGLVRTRVRVVKTRRDDRADLHPIAHGQMPGSKKRMLKLHSSPRPATAPVRSRAWSAHRNCRAAFANAAAVAVRL